VQAGHYRALASLRQNEPSRSREPGLQLCQELVSVAGCQDCDLNLVGRIGPSNAPLRKTDSSLDRIGECLSIPVTPYEDLGRCFDLFPRPRANDPFKARSPERHIEVDRLRAEAAFRAIEDALQAARVEQAGLTARVMKYSHEPPSRWN
jgi:hypothetical protein